MFEPSPKKDAKIEQSEHRILTTTEDNRFKMGKVRVEKCSHEMVLLIFRASTTVLKFAKIPQNTAHNSHHCLQLRENATNHSKNDKLDVQNSQKYHKKHGKQRQFDVQN